MSTLQPPSTVEKVAGSPATELALTAISAVAGGALAPLLPVLAKTLASKRQELRIAAALSEIDDMLREHGNAIQQISDEQYKLVNEIVLSVLQTTQQEKLEYLKHAAKNALHATDLKFQEAAVLSRALRDISAEEVNFLKENFHFRGLSLLVGDRRDKSIDNILRINPASNDALLVTGLQSLGLLIGGEMTYDSGNILRFSSVVAKLLALVRSENA